MLCLTRILYIHVKHFGMANIKYKITPVHSMKACKRSRSVGARILQFGSRWGEWSASCFRLFTLGKETWCPLARRLGGPLSHSEHFGGERNSCFCCDLNHRLSSLQLSHYTPNTIRAPTLSLGITESTQSLSFTLFMLSLTTVMFLCPLSNSHPNCCNPKNGGSMYLHNVGMYIKDCMAMQPKNHNVNCNCPCNPKITV